MLIDFQGSLRTYQIIVWTERSRSRSSVDEDRLGTGSRSTVLSRGSNQAARAVLRPTILSPRAGQAARAMSRSNILPTTKSIPSSTSSAKANHIIATGESSSTSSTQLRNTTHQVPTKQHEPHRRRPYYHQIHTKQHEQCPAPQYYLPPSSYQATPAAPRSTISPPNPLTPKTIEPKWLLTALHPSPLPKQTLGSWYRGQRMDEGGFGWDSRDRGQGVEKGSTLLVERY